MTSQATTEASQRMTVRGYLRWLISTPGVILLTFSVLAYSLRVLTRHETDFYSNPILILSLFRSDENNLWIFGAVLLCSFVLCWLKPGIVQSWKHAGSLAELRWFIVFVGFVLVWRYTTYPYNPVVDQAHHVDRLLCLLLLAGVVWRPIFIVPLLYLVYPIIWQFQSDVGAYSWAQQSMPLKLLLLFFIAFFYSHFNPKINSGVVVLLLLILIFSHYWAPGVGKLRIAWWTHGEIHNMVASTYANGWLNFLSQQDVSSVVRFVSRFDSVIVVLTLILEVGVLFVLISRKATILILLLATCFHFGVFFASGIFFWQWIMIDVAAVVLLSRMNCESLTDVFGRKNFLLSMVLIFLSPLWARPVKLAWHDTPVNYVYRFSLVDEFGKSVEAPPSCFAPFEYPFTQSTFSYLSEDTVLPITWGASNSLEIAVALSSATSVAEVKEIELQRGTVQFNSERAEKMDIFLNKFFSSDRDSPTARYWFDYVKSPSQLWTKSCDLELEGGRSDKINIVRVTSWFDGKHYREIDSQLVRVVDLTTTP